MDQEVIEKEINTRRDRQMGIILELCTLQQEHHKLQLEIDQLLVAYTLILIQRASQAKE